MKYRVLTRWPKSKPNWGCVPEHDGITLARARSVVKNAKHWQPCGLQQKIETTKGRVISVYKSRIATPEKKREIYFVYLSEFCN